MDEPSYLMIAKEMEAKMLRPRFTPFDATVRFFLEMTAGKTFLRLCRGNYTPLWNRIVPKPENDKQDAEAVIRQNFIPMLVNPVFDPDRPAPTSLAFPQWIASVLPPGIEDAEFSAFVKACVGVVENYKHRWEVEQNLLLGAKIIAFFGSFMFHAVIGAALVIDMTRGDHFGVLVAVLAICVGKLLGMLVSLEPWPPAGAIT